MRNTKDNFWHWYMKKEMAYVSNKNYLLNIHIDEINLGMFPIKNEGNSLCGIHDDDMLLFDSYFDFLDDAK